MFELESGLLRKFSHAVFGQTTQDEQNFSASLESHSVAGIVQQDGSKDNLKFGWEDEAGNQGAGTTDISGQTILNSGMVVLTALSLLAANNNVGDALRNGGTATGQMDAISSKRPVSGSFTVTGADEEVLEES